MKKLLTAFLLIFPIACEAICPNFVAHLTLTAAQLNSAFATPCITGGTVDGAPVGSITPSTGRFTSLILNSQLLPQYGGTGIANNALNTLTYTGAFSLGLTLSGNTSLTLPTSGTVTALGSASTGSGSIVLANTPTLTTPILGAATGTSLSVTGQLTSTVVTGTPPLSVASTTNVPNLNAATVNGINFATANAVTNSSLAQMPQLTLKGNNTTGTANALDLTVAQVAAMLGSPMYGARGVQGANNAGTPNTQYDWTASAVVLRNTSTGGLVVNTSPGTITNNISTAGSTANGRDQAGAFGASNWIHFYWIWNGTTLATVSSLTAPPTGPTLPSGYTHWAYAGAVYNNASPLLVATVYRGSWAYYGAAQNALVAGTAVIETTVVITSLIPPNALQFNLHIKDFGTNTTAAGVSDAFAVARVVTGINFVNFRALFNGTFVAAVNAYRIPVGSFTLPNISQTLYYLITLNTGTAPVVSLDISGFSVPNGS